MDLPIPPGWRVVDDKLVKQFTFADFPSAIAFMVEVSLHCQTADHHPEWTNVYNKVSVELTTHDANAITEKDLTLAATMDTAFSRRIST